MSRLTLRSTWTPIQWAKENLSWDTKWLKLTTYFHLSVKIKNVWSFTSVLICDHCTVLNRKSSYPYLFRIFYWASYFKWCVSELCSEGYPVRVFARPPQVSWCFPRFSLVPPEYLKWTTATTFIIPYNWPNINQVISFNAKQQLIEKNKNLSETQLF